MRAIAELGSTSLARDMAAFDLDRQARGLSTRTLEFYQAELRHLRCFLETQGVHWTQRVTPDHLRCFLIHLARTRNAGGVHAAYRALRAFFRWWQAEEETESNPVSRVRVSKLPIKLLEPVDLATLKAMLATCQRRTLTGDRDRALLLCLLDSGCRANEFLALNVSDVDFATGAVTVRSGKGGQARVTFFGARSRRALIPYLRHRDRGPGDPLWATVGGDRLTYWGLRSMVRRRAERAGATPPTLHSFRRGFALFALRAGADVYTLQRLMGHRDLTMLRRYLRQTDTDLALAHRRCGPVDAIRLG